MKTELILKSDVLDIIFEHRNKAYGAYDLRKFYDNRLMKSVAVMLAVVVVLSAFTFIPKKKNTGEKPEYVTTTGSILHPEKKAEVKEKKEITKPAQKPANTRRFLSKFVIIKDTTQIEKIDAIRPDDLIGNVNIDVPGEGGPVIVKPSGGEGGDPGPAEPLKLAVDVNTVLETAEIMPSFPGGMNALVKFLQRNLTNPREMEEGEQVSVKMRFVVGYDGKLKSFVTVEDGGEEFNKEVIRVLKKMPDWIPGKTKGQNVSVYYTIPVKFITGN